MKNKPTSISSRTQDLVGRTFHRLKVLSYVGHDSSGFCSWKCTCSCGQTIVTRGMSLQAGHTRSCGCMKFVHGMGSTRTYYSWVDMKRRCLNTNHYQYAKYGARGITVCKRWLTFTKFLQDMGVRPDGTSLDRINGRKGYSKQNCRWATAREQIINRSLTRWITFRGKTMCLADWAIPLGISASALAWRLDKAKWPKKYAMTLKGNPDRKLRDHQGRFYK